MLLLWMHANAKKANCTTRFVSSNNSVQQRQLQHLLSLSPSSTSSFLAHTMLCGDMTVAIEVTA